MLDFSHPSMVWLGFPRNGYIFCAKFALFSRKYFFANFCAIFAHETQWVLRDFAQFLLRKLRKTGNIFLRIFSYETKIVLSNFFARFAQNRKYYANRNFLSKLTKFEILCTELNNGRFIQLLHTKKWLTKKYA